MKKRAESRRCLVLALFSVMVILFAACGEDGRTNCSENGIDDCAQGEECHYYGNESDDWFCFLPCVDDGDCPEGETCRPGPSSCPTCMDKINVCM